MEGLDENEPTTNELVKEVAKTYKQFRNTIFGLYK